MRNKLIAFCSLLTAFCAPASTEVSVNEIHESLEELEELARSIEHTHGMYATAIIALLLGLCAICAAFIFMYIRNMRSSQSTDEHSQLPSFAKFKRHVERVLRGAKPNEYAVVSIDIDNFSVINDYFGYEVGNSLLMGLSSVFMESLGPDDCMCRIYADNFALFTRNLPYANLEDKICQLVFGHDNLRDIVTGIANADYPLRFSAGVYYVLDTRLSVYQMVNKADIARQRQKGKYRTPRLAEWTSQMESSDQWKKDITVTMETALSNKEFVVYYQPKFSFQSGRLIGAEALIRWQSPDRGMIMPGNFIPLFEQNGFIFKIDLMVFAEVCRFLEEWNRLCNKEYPLTISFNLSRNNLSSQEIPGTLTETLSKHDIAPSKVEIEITESFMAENQERMIKKIQEINNAGFSISIDDFGTGYSTLNILKDIPADIIKLDKEFVNSRTINDKESIIIKSVIDMAKKLDLQTVAEGVETKEQSDMLREMGCDIVQGYYYAKPMPENEFLDLLKAHYSAMHKTA